MKKAVQFGAGNIGRGFLGQLFSQSGYETVFVEANETLVSLLKDKRCYPLKIVGDNPRDYTIENVRAVSAFDKEAVAGEIVSADIIATAVGVDILSRIAPVIASGLEKRAESGAGPVNIIICENLLHAGNIFRKYVESAIGSSAKAYLREKVGFVETVVSRMIPAPSEEERKQNPLLVKAEEYGVLPVDGSAFAGEAPEVKGMKPCKGLTACEEQKLFVHNLGHAATAYAGYMKGYKYIWESIEDPEIKSFVYGILAESGSALNRKHGFTSGEQQSHIADLLHRFTNRDLGDPVVRVGRDPLRKLRPSDRFLGAASLAVEQGIKPARITSAIGLALCYGYAGDAQARKLSSDLKTKGIDYVLQETCRLKPEDMLYGMIRKKYFYWRKKMKAAVFEGIGKISIKDVPDPECGDNGIVVNVKSCAVCGTDVRTFMHGKANVKPPAIMGHEIAGVVEKTGSNVKGYSKGDRVAVAAVVSCGKCYYCKKNMQNLCENFSALGYEHQGGFAEYMPVPPEMLHDGSVNKLPEGLSFDEASLAEPFACAVNGQELSGVSEGDTVVVVGAGPIGCMHIGIARSFGAKKVIMVEINQERLDAAEQFGADAYVNPASDDLVKVVMDETGGRGADVVIVAAPAVKAIEQAVSILGFRGRLNCFGGLPKDKPFIKLDGNVIHYKELFIHGTSGSRPEHNRKALELFAAGKVDAKQFISNRFPLEKITEAIDAVKSGKGLKSVVNP